VPSPFRAGGSFATPVAAIVPLVVVLLASALPVACAAPAPSPPPSMIVIVVDTLRADHLGLYGYQANPTSPHLDARAPAAAVFERAYSTSSWTLPAFGSLFTGQIPTRHTAGVRVSDVEDAVAEGGRDDIVMRPIKTFYRLDESLPTLAETLQSAGYRTGAIMNNSFLGPVFGLGRGFDSYDFDRADPERLASQATDLALEWLGSREASDGAPFLLVVHYFDPHLPYRAPRPYLGRFAAQHETAEFAVPVADMDPLRQHIRARDEGWQNLAALERAQYDEEIAYTDSEVERLLAALEARGFLDSGYVLLTSDHGEEFFDHGRSEHGHTVFDEVVRVPLLVWGPALTPGRYQLPVSLVDLMPTLLDMAGAPPPANLQGVSIWRALREGPASRSASAVRFDRPLLAEGMLYGDEKKALIRWPWKLMVDIEDEGQWLFDLASDPAESARPGLDHLDESERERALTMMAELQAMISAASAEAGVGESASLSDETLERLRALGYIR